MSEYLAWSEEEIQLGFQGQSQYFNSEKMTTGEPSAPSRYFESEKYTTKDPDRLFAYPFSTISEIYQAGKTYGEKAIEVAKNIVSYPYEAFIKTIERGKPTGIITDETVTWKWSDLLKAPYIYFVFGIAGLWIYSVFKKR